MATRKRHHRPLESSDSVKVEVSTEMNGVNENNPVLNALDSQLQALQNQYQHQPNEQTRYQLVRHEQLIAQWAPARIPAG